ncbi:bolA-like protein 3 [Musca domestica]|uniref:BolA-like protein 3 n=1 Tax=Musca domestica TaxID=7370 RepID=A0A1I8NFH9_MUSDO|nr:bolA-like protein 3 [Musca domestica]
MKIDVCVPMSCLRKFKKKTMASISQKILGHIRPYNLIRFTQIQNVRLYSSTDAEKTIQQALANRFPKATIEVKDVSGGCGAMFEVFVETKEFAGLNTLKQHKLVTNTLKDQIKEMHGVRIHTAVPSSP